MVARQQAISSATIIPSPHYITNSPPQCLSVMISEQIATFWSINVPLRCGKFLPTHPWALEWPLESELHNQIYISIAAGRELSTGELGEHWSNITSQTTDKPARTYLTSNYSLLSATNIHPIICSNKNYCDSLFPRNNTFSCFLKSKCIKKW